MQVMMVGTANTMVFMQTGIFIYSKINDTTVQKQLLKALNS